MTDNLKQIPGLPNYYLTSEGNAVKQQPSWWDKVKSYGKAALDVINEQAPYFIPGVSTYKFAEDAGNNFTTAYLQAREGDLNAIGSIANGLGNTLMGVVSLVPFTGGGVKVVTGLANDFNKALKAAKSQIVAKAFDNAVKNTTPKVVVPEGLVISYQPTTNTAKTSLAFLERPSKLTAVERLGLTKWERNNHIKSPTNWEADDWFSLRWDKKWNPEEVEILASYVPEYREIERLARQNHTFMKMPDGSIFLGDPREWIMMMSKNGKNAYNPLIDSELLSGTYRSGTPNEANFIHKLKLINALSYDPIEKEYNPLSIDNVVWNGTNRDVTKSFGANLDLSYDPTNLNITDPKILERIKTAEIILNNEAEFLSKLLGIKVDPHYISNIDLRFYKGNATDIGLTEPQLEKAIKTLELFRIDYDRALWPEEGYTYTSLYPLRNQKGKIYKSPNGQMRNWNEIQLDNGTIGVTDDAVQNSVDNGYNFTIIENVREGGMNKNIIDKLINHDLIIHSGTPRVSFLGNNGNITGIGSVYNKQGGKLNYIKL